MPRDQNAAKTSLRDRHKINHLIRGGMTRKDVAARFGLSVARVRLIALDDRYSGEFVECQEDTERTNVQPKD